MRLTQSLLMARSTFRALLTIAGLLAASPAAAQFPNIFDSIFGNPPQRPPADVPSRRRRAGAAAIYSAAAAGGGLPPGPPPGSRIQTQPLPPPPGADQRAAAPPAPQQATPRRAAGAAASGPQPASLGRRPSNETVVEPPPNKIANPTAVFSGLDKITGRIISFDVAINETVRFGALEVTPRACYSRPPTEAPTTDGFIEVDELTLQGEIKRIFTGWMFAASPGLNAVEHPIYDVWLTDCKGAPQPTWPKRRRAPAAALPRARNSAQRRNNSSCSSCNSSSGARTQLPPPPAPPAAVNLFELSRRAVCLRVAAAPPRRSWSRRSAAKSASPTSAASSSL